LSVGGLDDLAAFDDTEALGGFSNAGVDNGETISGGDDLEFEFAMVSDQ